METIYNINYRIMLEYITSSTKTKFDIFWEKILSIFLRSWIIFKENQKIALKFEKVLTVSANMQLSTPSFLQKKIFAWIFCSYLSQSFPPSCIHHAMFPFALLIPNYRFFFSKLRTSKVTRGCFKKRWTNQKLGF